jgi:hypothetical protein
MDGHLGDEQQPEGQDDEEQHRRRTGKCRDHGPESGYVPAHDP